VPHGTDEAEDRHSNFYDAQVNLGTGVRPVTSGAALDSGPVFSPDGTKIAFASSRSGNGDIYVINVDGSGLRRVTTTNAIDLAPTWQP
jgi:TolB protein